MALIMQSGRIVEVPRWIYWKELHDNQRTFIREESSMLLNKGIRSDWAFNRLMYLLDYAKHTGLMDRQEFLKGLDLCSEWVLFKDRREQMGYELLMAVPWKLLELEREFRFD